MFLSAKICQNFDTRVFCSKIFEHIMSEILQSALEFWKIAENILGNFCFVGLFYNMEILWLVLFAISDFNFQKKIPNLCECSYFDGSRLSGIQFSANGTYDPWMSERAKLFYDDNIADCIREEYDNFCYTIKTCPKTTFCTETIHCVNGMSTAGENLADSAAIKVIFMYSLYLFVLNFNFHWIADCFPRLPTARNEDGANTATSRFDQL